MKPIVKEIKMMKKLLYVFSLILVLPLSSSAQTSVDEIVRKANYAAYYQGNDGRAIVQDEKSLIHKGEKEEGSFQFSDLMLNKMHLLKKSLLAINISMYIFIVQPMLLRLSLWSGSISKQMMIVGCICQH